MSLSARVALITGGGRGIGAACAKKLAQDGADIAITYRRDEAAAQQTVAALEAIGVKAMAVKCEISDEDQVKAAVEQVIATLGKIDILISNAGVASTGRTVRDTSTEEFRRLIDTHVMGSVWACQAVIDSMREQGRGHIVLITSVATREQNANSAPYSMAKTAMESLMTVLMREEGPNGIRVNVVGPGLVETDMGERLMKAHGVDNIKDLYKTFPFDKVCQPEDIANTAAFLCSDEGSYVNGQKIYVDGGGFTRRPR